MRYEDLVRDPEETLRTLFGWLGETWDARVLNFADRPHRFGAPPLRDDGKWNERNAEVRTTSIGVGHRPTTAVPFVIVRRTGGDLLELFGYA
jgi:hypothetical protein